MTRNNRRQESQARGGRSWLVVLAALAVFGLLASTPTILNTLHVHLIPVAATSSQGVTLLPAPHNPAPVRLPAVAQPIDPGQARASLPNVEPARETSVVTAEDSRIRTLLHDAVRIYQPEVIPVRGALPTLVLTAASRAYTAADLVQYGALVMLSHHTALLLDNIFVSANARLSFASPTLRALYMDSTSGGFASIVAWGGNVSFTGTPAHPFTLMGWDRATKSAAQDRGYGRSYVREVGGTMTLTDVRASSLGFWSGRTGGVAWTGRNGAPSRGSARDSTFTDGTYGAFVSRGQGMSFADDLFEFNELDGLHIHRYSVGSRVTSSSASRNGGSGFLVDRATQSTLLRGDVSDNNGINGYFIDGRPLVNGASASGGSVQPGTGTVLEDSAATSNARTGILVEGGAGTIIKSNQVCAKITAIAVRYGASNAVLTGNDIRCAPRSALSIGPLAPDAVISGNSLIGARIGMLVRNSGPVEVDNNHIFGATVFGITARGLSSQVKGVGNVISGTGFRAEDARADAAQPALYGTDTSGWVHHAKVTFWSYLQFHPLAALWLGILILVLLAAAWSFRRRLPPHPYPVSTRWRGPAVEVEEARPVPDHGPAGQPVHAAGPVPDPGPAPARHAVAAQADAPALERPQPEAPVWPEPQRGPYPWAAPAGQPPLREPVAGPRHALAGAFIEPLQVPPGRFEVPVEREPAEREPAEHRPQWDRAARTALPAGPPWETTTTPPASPAGNTEDKVAITRPLPKVAD